MKQLSLLLVFGFVGIVHGFSQTQQFDIATFTPPQGWQRTETSGSIAYYDSKTSNGLTSFCQIILYPSSTATNNAAKNFKVAWQNLVVSTTKSKAKPVTQTEKTPDGWTVVTGAANVAFQGVTYKSIVSNITGFGKTMSVQVNTAGGDYTGILENFFNDLNLDSKAPVSNTSWQNNTSNNQPAMNGPVSMNDYDFIAPQGWQTQKNADHIQVQNPQSGCLIRILSPQPSSGNLEQDVNAVFDMMYKGWQYQKSGSQQYTLSRGFLAKGLEFYMKEATMSTTYTDGRYELQDGAALVVKAGNQVVIISVRHSGLMAHVDCLRKYDTWRRFFNSFTVKNATIPKTMEDPAQRIVGSWSMAEAGATGEYVFAANGNYALIGAIGSSYTSRDYNYEYLHIKTYAFQGDGSYTIAGNQLTLKKKSSSPQLAKFRFEQVKHGSDGWKDRIYILKNDEFGQNEVGYEKMK